MSKLNMEGQELRDYIDLSASIIEPDIEDIYITKRLLTQDGMSEEDVDSFIGAKIREHDKYFSAMDDEEYNEYVSDEKDRIFEEMAKAQEEAGPDGDASPRARALAELRDVDLEHMPSLAEMMLANLNIIDGKVKQVMFIKRGMEEVGIDPTDIAFAITDSAKEFDERFMKMPQDEFDEYMFNKILGRLLGEDIPMELADGDEVLIPGEDPLSAA